MKLRPILFQRLGTVVLLGAVPLAGCVPVAVVPARPAVVVAPVPPPVVVAPAPPAVVVAPAPAAVVVTPAPTVVAVRRAGEPLKEFDADEHTCRVYAAEMIGNPGSWLPPSLQRRYDFTYSRCMISRGYTIEVQGAPVMYAPAPVAVVPAPPVVAVVPVYPPRPRVIFVP
jgi:hypothetical protein